MNARTLRERVIYGSAYSTFFLLAFVFFAYHTFPYDRLRDVIVDKLSAGADPTSGETIDAKIGKIAPSWITGVEIDDLDLVKTTHDNPAPVKLHMDEVTLRVSALSFLFGGMKGSVKGSVGSGTLDASYSESDETEQIDAEIHDLDVEKMGLGAWLAGVPFKGMAYGTINLTLEKDPSKSTGDIDVKIDALRVGDGKAKMKVPGMQSGFTLDEIDAGNLNVKIAVNDGVADFEKLGLDGKDLKLDGDGSARLATPLKQSRLDLQLQLKFSDSYKNKSDRTKAMFELIGMQPDLRRAQGSDGAMNVHVGGSLQALRMTPGGVGRAGRAPRVKRAADKAAKAEAK